MADIRRLASGALLRNPTGELNTADSTCCCFDPCEVCATILAGLPGTVSADLTGISECDDCCNTSCGGLPTGPTFTLVQSGCNYSLTVCINGKRATIDIYYTPDGDGCAGIGCWSMVVVCNCAATGLYQMWTGVKVGGTDPTGVYTQGGGSCVVNADEPAAEVDCNFGVESITVS